MWTCSSPYSCHSPWCQFTLLRAEFPRGTDAIVRSRQEGKKQESGNRKEKENYRFNRSTRLGRFDDLLLSFVSRARSPMILLLDNNFVRGRRRRVPPSASSLKMDSPSCYEFWLTWLRRLIETLEAVERGTHNAVRSRQHVPSCDTLFTETQSEIRSPIASRVSFITFPNANASFPFRILSGNDSSR